MRKEALCNPYLNLIKYFYISRISTGEKIIIHVESNVEINYLIYKIIGGSSLIDSKLVKFSPSKEYTLEIQSTPSMGASFDVLIYYITEDGELVSDKVNVDVNNLPNYVSKHFLIIFNYDVHNYA